MAAAKMLGYLKELARDLLCLIYFNNIKELRVQKERLILARAQLRKDVDDAKAREREIKEDVEKWLRDAKKFLEAVRSMEYNIKANKWRLISRLNWSQRCRLSKEIEDLKHNIVHHVRHSHYDRAVLATLWENDFPRDFMPSQSLKSAVIGVVNAMKDECDPSVIVVCGPRGVGKTTLAELVEKKAQELLNFKVVRFVFSQSTNTEEVQEKLAAFLKMNLQNKSREERVEHLRLRLKTERRILIILDNICEELNLVSIGIPYHVSCKVLVTTSDEQVCSSIRTSKIIQLGVLHKSEAWKLLEDNLSPDTSSEVKLVAKRIAEEFKHSPISIITIGRALRGEVLGEWINAYQILGSRLAEGEKDNFKIVCRSIKLSYDYLKEPETKKCFLLCSLFPEDYPIAVLDLKRFAWGLGIYQGIDSIEIVGKRVAEAIKSLEKSFLLLEQGKTHVRMPNVIREAALLIASKDETVLRLKSLVGLWERPNNEDLATYTAISYVACQQEELHDEEFQSEKLQILFLGGDSYKTISNDFLQRLTALKVLAIHHGLLSTNALQNLTNLKALHLEYCKLDGRSSLGQMKQLEILSLQGSDITELPDEIVELNNLRLLDLSGCQKLQRIPLNLIRGLSRLEELYFSGRSFEQWWSEQRSAEGSNTNLSMINSFSSLATELFEYQESNNECDATSRTLKVSAFFQNESNESKSTVTRLDRDRILFVQNQVLPNLVQSVKKVKVQRCDKWQEVFQNGRFLHAGEDDSGALLSDLTSLELEELSQLSSLSSICYLQTTLVGLQNLNTLKLKDCRNLQSLFSMTLAQSLSQLETLEIHGCEALKQIIDDTRHDVDVDEIRRPVDVKESKPTAPRDSYQCLPRLKTLVITGCGALEYIFQITTCEVLPELTHLEIINCLQLKEVFSSKDAAHVEDIRVPQLQRLKLEGLMILRTICPENLSMELPLLQHLEVGGCRKLNEKALFKLIGNRKLKEFFLFEVGSQLCEKIFEYEGGCLLSHLKELKLENLNELHALWKQPTQIVTLQNLTRLELVKCNKLRNVFSLLIARNLLQLSHLVVQECDELVQLVSRDQIPSSSRYRPEYFPNLEKVLIQDCNKLKSLFPVSVARLPKLKTLSVRRAFGLVEIFRHEGEARAKSEKETKGTSAKLKIEKEIIKLRFPSLETLHLEHLTTLVTFNPVDYCCEFPRLKSLRVKDCNSLVTRFETSEPKSESESGPIVHAKTNEASLLKLEKFRDKLRRSVTVVEIPTYNGDIDWSPGMKID